jgi:hypothetical protein
MQLDLELTAFVTMRDCISGQDNAGLMQELKRPCFYAVAAEKRIL